MAYQPMQTADGSDHVKIGLTIQGKRYDAVFHKNRFERVMDKVDNSIHRGKDVDTIRNKYRDHLVSLEPHVEPKPAKVKKAPAHSTSSSAQLEFDKVAHVAKYVHENPASELGTIAKSAAATSGGRLTYANARYIANRLRTKGK
jgi:hypothetical protein